MTPKEILIERIELIKESGGFDCSEFDSGVRYACDKILSFLEFLPERISQEPYGPECIYRPQNNNRCGKCGYFLRHKSSGTFRETTGDCACLAMNEECYEEKVDPFLPWAKEEGHLILQVAEEEKACGFFRKGRTSRVRRLLKQNPNDYENK